MQDQDRLITADIRARHWIARMNELDERGVKGYMLEEAERKAQYWLDRFNRLNGDA